MRECTQKLILVQNIPYMLFFILLQIIIRDKPEFPPSAVAAAPIADEQYCASFKVMWANKNFMILAFSYAIVYGVYVDIGTAMSNLLNPFGYSPTDLSITGGVGLLAGVVSALFTGCFLDKTARYRQTHISLSAMVVLSIITVILMLIVGSGQLIEILLPCLLLGASSVSFFPASLSYGAELTFPLQPALVNACMNFLGQLFAFLMMGMSILITDVDAANIESISLSYRQKRSYLCMSILALMALLNFVLSLCIKEELRRVNYKPDETRSDYVRVRDGETTNGEGLEMTHKNDAIN